ncbi:glycine--tRNA ligase [Glycomyces buryatensis]|uniref:Multifunctional fusion protein n=1 Tax=Glycomyces buryatensis TaxID=2570927 RepID=A0A4S8PX93_9ACTN|nr:glycine--tRNA ligase [Glycomyces buryatensis]THV34685.1 glycine--tRNA ligase [Glycomyces buryatensis]
MTDLTMQDALARLTTFWSGHGCLTVQPMNTEVGAGTLNPATSLRVLGPEPWKVAYVEPSVRPDDARYGDNPNRIQMHTQFQVILKPEPGNAQELYLESLAALGIDTRAHDIRFVEDNWASPALGAWGLGWEVWLDGLEITQFTYFQQSGGVALDPVSVEITYGMERILMALQGVRHFKEIAYAPGISYGEVFGQGEYEMSRYYLDDADIATHRELFDRYGDEAARMVELGLPIPAHVNVLKMSHAFNVLDARGAVSTSDRATAFARMRGLAHEVAEQWIAKRGQAGFPLGTVEPEGKAAPAPIVVPADTDPQTVAFEIGVEEMPPAEAQAARTHVEQRLRALLEGAHLDHGDVIVHATPRRIVAQIAAVAASEPDRTVTARGPKTAAAFDAEGNPTKAALGFARSNGVDVADLTTVESAGATHVAAVRTQNGRHALEVFADVIGDIAGGLRSGKNMRWSDPKLAFTRPIRWLGAMWGPHVIPAAASGLAAGRLTRAHRSSDEPILPIAAADDLAPALERNGIVLNEQDRRRRIVAQAAKAARAVDGAVDFDAEAALVDQVNFLVEQPVAVLGSFDESYLDLPDEVLTSVMRKHQRYFPVRGGDGELLPHFVAVANGPIDEPTVRVGNEAVLRARFEDAAFFYRADLKTPIEEMRQRLGHLAFADRLGSIADRADRIRAIAAALADLADIADEDRRVLTEAAALVKFDLGSQLVTEMTSLAGTLARTYALEAGKDGAVAEALFEAELPRQAGDRVPESTAGALLALADRLDFFVGLGSTVGMPTGSKDPFALRRAALGLIAVHRAAAPAVAHLSLHECIRAAASVQPVEVTAEHAGAMEGFLRDRLAQQLIDEGRRFDLVAAVLPLAERPALAEARLSELESELGSDRFERLAAAMQRISRILPSDVAAVSDFDRLTAASEQRLIAVLGDLDRADGADGRLDDWIELAAGLPDAVDAFFEEVLVMDPDPQVRSQRLGLLSALHRNAASRLDWSAVQI